MAPSQYQARRLLELVSANKARVRPNDHVDRDRWGRQQHPPLRGRVFPTRHAAVVPLAAGALCATPQPALPSPVEALPTVAAPSRPTAPLVDAEVPAPMLADVDKGSMALGVRAMPRVSSAGSKMSKISSVPSFGKMREPLSGDSVRLSALSHVKDDEPPNSLGRRPRTGRAAPAEYEEFGSEALITHVYDDLESDYDVESETPSRLFRSIGPSISMAHGIDQMAERRVDKLDPPVEHVVEVKEHNASDVPPPVYEPVYEPQEQNTSQQIDESPKHQPSSSHDTNPMYEANQRLDALYEPHQPSTTPPPPPPPQPYIFTGSGVPPPPAPPPPFTSRDVSIAPSSDYITDEAEAMHHMLPDVDYVAYEHEFDPTPALYNSEDNFDNYVSERVLEDDTDTTELAPTPPLPSQPYEMAEVVYGNSSSNPSPSQPPPSSSYEIENELPPPPPLPAPYIAKQFSVDSASSSFPPPPAAPSLPPPPEDSTDIPSIDDSTPSQRSPALLPTYEDEELGVDRGSSSSSSSSLPLPPAAYRTDAETLDSSSSSTPSPLPYHSASHSSDLAPSQQPSPPPPLPPSTHNLVQEFEQLNLSEDPLPSLDAQEARKGLFGRDDSNFSASTLDDGAGSRSVSPVTDTMDRTSAQESDESISESQKSGRWEQPGDSSYTAGTVSASGYNSSGYMPSGDACSRSDELEPVERYREGSPSPFGRAMEEKREYFAPLERSCPAPDSAFARARAAFSGTGLSDGEQWPTSGRTSSAPDEFYSAEEEAFDVEEVAMLEREAIPRRRSVELFNSVRPESSSEYSGYSDELGDEKDVESSVEVDSDSEGRFDKSQQRAFEQSNPYVNDIGGGRQTSTANGLRNSRANALPNLT